MVDAALAILEDSRPSDALLDRVAALGATIAVSRRARLATLVGARDVAAAPRPAPSTPSSTTIAVSAADAERAGLAALANAPPEGPWPRVTLADRENPAPRLDPARLVAPIADVAELLVEAARAVEDPKDVLAFERVLDGISRLGAPRSALPPDATTTLAKRAAKLRAIHPVVTLVRGWLAGDLGDPFATRDEHVNTMRFGERRVRNVLARLMRNETRPLLALPSTGSFFVDPCAFAARVKAVASAELDRADAVTALLRLAPEHREPARELLAGVEGVLASAARHALGGEGETPDDRERALWLAAERARTGEPVDLGVRWERWEPVGAGAPVSWGNLVVDFPPPPPGHLDPDAFQLLLAMPASVGDGTHYDGEADLRAMASIDPGDRRTLLAHGLTRIARNVAWMDTAWENHVFIELLLDADLPLDDISLPLLAAALNAKEARENALATDALVAAIADGRVVGPELGAAMATFWDPIHDEVTWSQRVTSARWARTLATVAQTSALHAEVVRRTIEALFAAPPRAPSPDAHALLQLWLDLAVEARVAVPDPSALAPYLGGSGKTKKIAAQLRALTGSPKSVHADDAHAIALADRRARAERWTAWRG